MSEPGHHHVCPFWIGYLLASPLRKFWHNPNKILSPYLKPDMQVLDFGSAMGFFSLPMAKMVGPSGKVICIDIQEKMIKRLKERAQKANLLDRIETHVCSETSLGLDRFDGVLDFALAFAVVHEVPDPVLFFSQMYRSLKDSAKILIAEPNKRVSPEDFQATINTALSQGFHLACRPSIWAVSAAVLEKPAI